MASQGREISHKAGEMTGQAQLKKDEHMNKASEACQAATNKSSSIAGSAKESASEATGQASTFIQQTGEQVKSMAQGAAEAVKNTLGMNTDSSSTNKPNY